MQADRNAQGVQGQPSRSARRKAHKRKLRRIGPDLRAEEGKLQAAMELRKQVNGAKSQQQRTGGPFNHVYYSDNSDGEQVVDAAIPHEDPALQAGGGMAGPSQEALRTHSTVCTHNWQPEEKVDDEFPTMGESAFQQLPMADVPPVPGTVLAYKLLEIGPEYQPQVES